MQRRARARSWIKFIFWGAATVTVFTVAVQAYSSGQMARWYFHKAKTDGYAVNDSQFRTATPEHPTLLQVETVPAITGLQAVPVKRGDVLPENATGVIDSSIVKAGKRVALEGSQLKVTIPTETVESKGFVTNESFRLKNVETDPAGAVWNLVTVLAMGLTLGFLAESITDLLGIKVAKSASAH